MQLFALVIGRAPWGLRVAGLAGLCVLEGGTALAQSDGIVEHVQLDGRVALRVLLSDTRAEPLATADFRLPHGARAAGVATARQTMLWVQPGRSAVALGLGLEQRPLSRPAGEGRTGPGASGLLAGIALPAGPGALLTLQTPLIMPSGGGPADDSELVSGERRQLRMGLTFDGKKPRSDLRRGLRVELSGQTSLTLRPRGGGRVGLSLQSQW